jgi:transaldolase
LISKISTSFYALFAKESTVLLFLDTANLDEIAEIASWGVLDGVTTNPSLVSKEKRDFKKLVKEICKIVKGPVSAEVVAEDAEGMLKEGRDIATWAENVVVKCPLTPNGLQATSKLSKDGIKVNVTLCFSVNQALLAARAGAYFVSPFIGRLDDINEDGCALVEQIAEMYHIQSIETNVLAASIRTPPHVCRVALAGADAATMPYKVFKQLVQHPLTDIGMEKFLADWRASQAAVAP